MYDNLVVTCTYISCVEALVTEMKIEKSFLRSNQEIKVTSELQKKSADQESMATVWPLNHRKSTNQEPQKGTIKRSRTPIRNLDLSHKHFNRRHMTTHNLMRQEIHEGRRRRHPGSPLVSQTIPFTARRRVWSCCNYWVVAKERNYWPLQLGNKMLTSAKHMM